MKVQVRVYLEAEVVRGSKRKGGISVVPKGTGRWKADSRKGESTKGVSLRGPTISIRLRLSQLNHQIVRVLGNPVCRTHSRSCSF